jgi:NlpC/P60 family putative phage cell wall peptidase
MPSRGEIVTEARSWMGTKFHHQASLKGVGCDCIGLVRGVARGVGFRDPFTTGEAIQFAGYGRTPEPKRLLEACERFLQRIAIDAAIAGDILLLRFEREPQHFALLTSRHPDQMIHSHASVGRVTESGIDAKWWRRVLRAYRFQELA